MAFNRTDDPGLIEPRDPSAITARRDGGGILSTVILLLIIAAAVGLYFVYAGSSPVATIDATPPVTPMSHVTVPAPVPATQPPTQTPTP
jgi:hypothetical protein